MPRRIETERRPGRIAVAAFVGLGLLSGGVILGRALPGAAKRASSVTTTVARTEKLGTGTVVTAPRGYTRTPAGAAAAAGAYVAALGGRAILEPARMRETLERIASPSALHGLERAYARAGAQVRSRFGMHGEPKPVVILRSAPVGYRVERFTPPLAVVAVWDVGIVGSGANVDPQASWRTEQVTLLWDGRTWKAAGFRSASGPTPPLAAGNVETPPAALFAAIPGLREYADVRP